MNMNRDFDRLAATWLADGPVELSDRVLDAALSEVHLTRQRRAARVPWRYEPVSVQLKVAGLVAVVIVVAVAGFLLVQRGPESPTGVGATTKPTPSIALSPSPVQPSASVPPRPLGLAIVALDGTVRQDLGLPRDAWSADLSADGTAVVFPTRSREIAFCGQCLLSHHLVAVDVGAAEGTVILPNSNEVIQAATIAEPAWSPDGTRVAFQAAAVGSTNLDIWVVDVGSRDASAAEAGLRRLTTSSSVDEFPAWSADGQTIYYANAGSEPLDDSGFSSTQEIWTVPAEGGTPRQLTSNSEPDTQPDVRADDTIAFWHAGDIWSMAADGSNQSRLAAVPGGLGFNPRWSPDGTKLAVLRFFPDERAILDQPIWAGTNYPLLDVVVVNLATGSVAETGQRVASDLNPPSWLPDGSALLIYRYDEGR